MAISGDLKALNLTDLFQTLAQANQQGTLTVTDGPRTKNFIFTARGITLETSEDQLTASLGEILVARGDLTLAGLSQAEAACATKGQSLEEALIELELADRRAVDRALRTQVEEEMYDVFSWDEARFEFHPGTRTAGGDRPAPKTRLLFNVSGLLMEAARRLDEWKMIHEVIPGLAAIVVPVGKLDPAAFDGIQRTAAGLCDGERTVAQICAEGHLPRFDTCKFLKELVDAGKAKLLDAKDLAARGAARLEAGNTESGVALLRLALRLHPALHSYRLQLAEALEADRPLEAAAEYRRLARVKLLQNDPKQALAIQRVAHQLAPDDVDVRAELFDIAVDHAERLDATPSELTDAHLPYVRALVGAGRTHDAEQALDRLAAKAPDQAEVWRLKVNLRLEAGDPAGAVTAYHRIVPLCEAEGDRRGVREALQNILKLAPGDAEARARLQAVESGAVLSPLAASSGPVPAAPRRRIPWAAIIGVVLVVAGAGVIGWRELRAGDALAAARVTVEALEQAGDLRGAAASLRAVHAAWPWTMAVSGLDAEARALELKAEKAAAHD